MERSAIRRTASSRKTASDFAALYPGYETHAAGSTVISGQSAFQRAAFAS
jgi:hypothetical protein